MRRRLILVWLAIAAVGLAAANYAMDSRRTPLREHATKVLVVKSDHKMLLYNGDRVIRIYKVAIGRGGLDAKERQGDHRSPEGEYVVDRRKPNSRFHRALHISYPNEFDRQRAHRLGVDPGGEIMIHGIQNGLGWIGLLHRAVDWTDGCIAVTDSEIDEIWAAVPDGTPIEIRR